MPRTPGRKAKAGLSREESPAYDLFEIEVIQAARPTASRRWEYWVKWAGCKEDENTWEPEDNLGGGCERLLESFWKNMEDQEVELRATAAWIKSEKKKYQAENGKAKPAESKKRPQPTQEVKRVGRPPKRRKTTR